MIEVPTIDELRDARRRLAEQAGLDIQQYAALLQEMGRQSPATYVVTPLLPQPWPPPVPAVVPASEGAGA
jgi:hypothetical protein